MPENNHAPIHGEAPMNNSGAAQVPENVYTAPTVMAAEAGPGVQSEERAVPPVQAAFEAAALEESGAGEPMAAVKEVAAAEEVAEATETPAAAEVAGETGAAEETAAAPSPARETLFKRGDIVEGTVIQTTPTEILVDLDGKAQGVVSGRELARMDRAALDELRVGHTVLAFVLNPENRSGYVVLSLSRALEERDWRMAAEYKESQTTYATKVSGYNKGGLIVRFGRVRGFIPASQVSKERRQRAVGESPLERWGSMIGEDITVRVMEVDRERNRLILSERVTSKEARDQRKAELLETLQVGDIRKGRVVSLTDFGAFVDLGGADGLIHLTELSWKHVTRPQDILQIGQEVEVEVISLDRERRRIGLSLKGRAADPWETVVSRFRVGQLVKGTITKLTRFGAFARLDDAPEIEGLIHISELADHRVAHPKEVVNEGEVLTLRIVKIDRAQRRMGLSLKQVNAVDYMEIDLASYSAPAPLINGDDLDAPDGESR